MANESTDLFCMHFLLPILCLFEYLKKKSSSSVSAMVMGKLLLFIWKHSLKKLHMLKIGQVRLKWEHFQFLLAIQNESQNLQSWKAPTRISKAYFLQGLTYYKNSLVLIKKKSNCCDIPLITILLFLWVTDILVIGFILQCLINGVGRSREQGLHALWWLNQVLVLAK